MNPLSTASVRPSSPATSWVWACPPIRSSASKTVTSSARRSTYAAVRPATPLPTTAILRLAIVGTSSQTTGLGGPAATLRKTSATGRSGGGRVQGVILSTAGRAGTVDVRPAARPPYRNGTAE